MTDQTTHHLGARTRERLEQIHAEAAAHHDRLRFDGPAPGETDADTAAWRDVARATDRALHPEEYRP